MVEILPLKCCSWALFACGSIFELGFILRHLESFEVFTASYLATVDYCHFHEVGLCHKDPTHLGILGHFILIPSGRQLACTSDWWGQAPLTAHCHLLLRQNATIIGECHFPWLLGLKLDCVFANMSCFRCHWGHFGWSQESVYWCCWRRRYSCCSIAWWETHYFVTYYGGHCCSQHCLHTRSPGLTVCHYFHMACIVTETNSLKNSTLGCA